MRLRTIAKRYVHLKDEVRAVEKHDGVDTLFPPQEEALEAGLLDKGSFLLVFGTGSGKTLMGELPALSPDLKPAAGKLANEVKKAIEKAFAQYGEVSAVNIIKDRETGRSRGFAFVEMPDDDEARNAIAALNEQENDGRTMRVNEARPRN